MNGNVVMRERGVILTTIPFDTGGDHVPSGETVEVREVRVAEPHPTSSSSMRSLRAHPATDPLTSASRRRA